MNRAAAALLVMLLAACASGPVSAARLTSSRGVGLGTQRLVVEFVDRGTNAPMAIDRPVVATLRDRDGSPLGESVGQTVWLVTADRRAQVFVVEVPEEGTYQVTFTAEGSRFSGPLGFEALEARPVVEVGEAAPRSETPTTGNHALGEVTSDPEPDPSLYDTSVADAVQSGRAVIVFGSPAHCLSVSCAAVLDVVKEVAPEFGDFDFVHVETVEDPQAGDGDGTTHIAAVAEWGLVVEPVVFVVVDGLVTAYFESALSADELRSALASGGG